MNDFKKICMAMRRDVITLGKKAGAEGIHYGGSYSLIEIVAALYINVIKLTSASYFLSEDRVRVIFSKGHGISSYYSLLHQVGILTDADFDTFEDYGSKLNCHPTKNKNLGMDYSAGSLGQGASIACGVAISLKKKNIDSRVYVIIGDGELDEGSNWEAFMAASKYNLNNLTVIIDKNNLQLDGETKLVMPTDSIEKKLSSFGFDTMEIDGHNIDEITKALQYKTDKPVAIIANTVKGKGVSFMENQRIFHQIELTNEQYEIAEKELAC